MQGRDFRKKDSQKISSTCPASGDCRVRKVCWKERATYSRNHKTSGGRGDEEAGGGGALGG